MEEFGRVWKLAWLHWPLSTNFIDKYFVFFILNSEKQRAQKVFKAQIPLDLQGAKNKLSGFGVQILESIDPNPDNLVCAGIIHTQSHQVGCLLRLEPNKQAQVVVIFKTFSCFMSFNEIDNNTWYF